MKVTILGCGGSGGVPLIVHGTLYGAVAASGAKAVQDEACAQAGAAAILARLGA